MTILSVPWRTPVREAHLEVVLQYRFKFELGLSLLVFYVTCNDISVIYVTAQMCRWIGEVVPTVGLPTP